MSATKRVKKLQQEVRFLRFGLLATWVLLGALFLMGQASSPPQFIEAKEIRVGEVTINADGIRLGPSAVHRRTLTLEADRITATSRFDTVTLEPGGVSMRGLRGKTSKLTAAELKMVGETNQEIHISTHPLPFLSVRGLVDGAINGIYLTPQSAGQ